MATVGGLFEINSLDYTRYGNMAQITEIFDKNFIEYASYVIKDRAIPDIDDGLKPVQRRILYTLHKMEDGTFHKVAAVVGQTMFLHPHGDASIYEALVALANRDILIEKQGNFGNLLTGDPPAAARYIECTLSLFANEILFDDELTSFVASYDGKIKEPVVLPCKIPLTLLIGAEGIAVGMSTRILPHNAIEVLDAVKKCLRKKPFQLFPDFFSGGLIDVSQYQDGLGKVLVRARLELKDQKHIVISELPYGSTVESLIQSIDDAAKRGKLRIGSINDYTAEKVEIEIELPRGVYASDVIDALYAFTNCETSISVNCLLIKDRKPQILTVTEIIEYHTLHLCKLLKQGLQNEKDHLLEKLRRCIFERIFIENRVYKLLEDLKNNKEIITVTRDGLLPFVTDKIKLPITNDDIEYLLLLPIRRITLFDIEKNRKILQDIEKRVKIIDQYLSDIISYASNFLDTVLKRHLHHLVRRTEISNFQKIDVRHVALRNLKLYYDSSTGYIGYAVTTGTFIADVSVYDRVFVMKKDTSYQIYEVSEKFFMGNDVLYVTLAEKELFDKMIFNIIYKSPENKFGYIKRFKITQFLTNRPYKSILPEKSKLLAFAVGEDNDLKIEMEYKQRELMKEGQCLLKNYAIRGIQAQGLKISSKEVVRAKFLPKKG